jgi:hypothetical protein
MNNKKKNDVIMPWEKDALFYFSVDNFLKASKDIISKLSFNMFDKLAKLVDLHIAESVRTEQKIADTNKSKITDVFYLLNDYTPIEDIIKKTGLLQNQIEALGLYSFLKHGNTGGKFFGSTDIDPNQIKSVILLHLYYAELQLIIKDQNSYIERFVVTKSQPVLLENTKLLSDFLCNILNGKVNNLIKNDIIQLAKNRAQLSLAKKLTKLEAPVKYIVEETGLSRWTVEQLGLELLL